MSKVICYHLSPELYDGIAANNGRERPLKGAHKNRQHYDSVVLEEINRNFMLPLPVKSLLVY